MHTNIYSYAQKYCASRQLGPLNKLVCGTWSTLETSHAPPVSNTSVATGTYNQRNTQLAAQHTPTLTNTKHAYKDKHLPKWGGDIGVDLHVVGLLVSGLPVAPPKPLLGPPASPLSATLLFPRVPTIEHPA